MSADKNLSAADLAAAAQEDIHQEVAAHKESEAEQAAAALGDAAEDTAEEPAEGADAAPEASEAEQPEKTAEEASMEAYKTRLREFMRALKKLPGEWYIIQCYSGYENKVKTNLEMRAQTLGVDEQIHEVVVPIEEVTELKDGKRKQVKRKLLPGYVLVRIELDDASWSVVRDTPGVTSFVGNEGKPTPVKIREVAKFLLPPETATAAAEDQGQDAADVDVSATGVAVPPKPASETVVWTTRWASPSPSSPARSHPLPRPSPRSIPSRIASRQWSPSSAVRPRLSWNLIRSRSSINVTLSAIQWRAFGVPGWQWNYSSPVAG